METIYKKKTSPDMDREFEAAAVFGKVKIGTEHFFWRKNLRWYYVPAERVTQVYRQIQQVTSHTSCCETDFSIHRLILLSKEGEELSVLVGDSMYRHEPERMMEEIARLHPQIIQLAPQR
ncbi:MAG: hypothetical protein Q4B59_00665 [Lachnospiraceae bacterium]|nr:hypothetical protein [Lachnospiraceae bacterium]